MLRFELVYFDVLIAFHAMKLEALGLMKPEVLEQIGGELEKLMGGFGDKTPVLVKDFELFELRRLLSQS